MKIKDWLKLNGLSVSDLAKATNIPHATLLSYSDEKHEPSLKNALKIVKATCGAITCEDLVLEKE